MEGVMYIILYIYLGLFRGYGFLVWFSKIFFVRWNIYCLIMDCGNIRVFWEGFMRC